jgi:four helix bundle protein
MPVYAHATVFVTRPTAKRRAAFRRVAYGPPAVAQARTRRATAAHQPRAKMRTRGRVPSARARRRHGDCARKGKGRRPSGAPAEGAHPMHHDLPRFAHDRLDAYAVARQALVLGEGIARDLPRGYATLSDQLRRALLSTHLGIAEAASRTGADRLARFRCARGEASEAAAALDAALALGLANPERVNETLALLGRLYAMLTRLAKAGR